MNWMKRRNMILKTWENDVDMVEDENDLESDEEENSDTDHNIEENMNVTEVDTGDLDFEDDNVDDEKSDKEEESDTDHDIKENKNELNEQCEHDAYDGNVCNAILWKNKKSIFELM